MDKQGLKILIIDDSELNQKVFIRSIRDFFNDVVILTASSGAEGILCAENENPDMIFLDIIMPEMDGFEVCEKIKVDDQMKDIPVVFMTAGPSNHEYRLMALEHGAEGFMARPYDEVELVTQVKAMAKIRKANLLKKDEEIRLREMVELQTAALKRAHQKSVELLKSLKKENKARKKSESALKQAQRIAQLGSFEHDVYTDKILYSEEALNVLAVKEDTVNTLGKLADYLGKSCNDVEFRDLMSDKGIQFSSSVKDLNEKYVKVQMLPLFADDGQHIGNIGTIQDISEIKIKENRILYLSYHDYLTGLHNRRYFDQRLSEMDSMENYPISLVIADVNGLKMVNDSFGHGVGDELLIRAAELMKKELRPVDVIARLGGDEFMMILPGVTKEEATELTNRIEKEAAKELIKGIELSISFGIDTKSSQRDDITVVQKNAEDEMYHHKLYTSTSMRSKTIDLIINSLYEKSNREMFHSKRVGDLCNAIAQAMAVDSNMIKQIALAGLLHDIGKMGVEENILNKPASLDLSEWEQMKRHPEMGYRILCSSEEFTEVARYVFEHHEKWDGSGYPKGLKGVEISLQARIIGVADSYDAMTSDRSYRKGLSEEDAISELRRNAGTQFDPAVAKVFVEQVLGKSWVAQRVTDVL
ncbi:diguanylate cyclase [Eubacteriaceae bacterium ES3]|nr:diguanylate cyclase [Eubacteriaceae bacterium ES3]